ncbi:MAG: DUF4230 domain-containing protein [Cyanophyceae cyanobacterium]
MLGLFKRQDTKDTPKRDTKLKDTEPKDKRPAVMQPIRSIPALLVGGGLVLAAVTVNGIGNWTRDIGGWMRENLAVTQSAPKVDVRSLTINKIRGASELTTMVYSTEAIIPTSRDLQLGQVTVGSTRLLYIAYGEVRAGIDLAAVKKEDVVWDGSTLTVTLPAPKILDSKIDVTRSRVYDYNRGFLGLGPDVAPELITLAQQKALDTVTQSACDRGLMTQAGERAKTVVGQLLGGAITDATIGGTADSAAPAPQPVIEIIVPEGEQLSCSAASSQSSSTSVPDGAIAPAVTSPAPSPQSAPSTPPSKAAPAQTSSESNNAPPSDPLPVPAVP